MSRHLRAVPSVETWPPPGLRELGERIAAAAGVLIECARSGPYEAGHAAAEIVAAASRVEVLIHEHAGKVAEHRAEVAVGHWHGTGEVLDFPPDPDGNPWKPAPF